MLHKINAKFSFLIWNTFNMKPGREILIIILFGDQLSKLIIILKNYSNIETRLLSL